VLNTLKWLGTFLCLTGITLSAFNVFPLYLWFGLAGSGLWALVAAKTSDDPLLVVEAAAVVVYVVGILYNWIGQI